MKKRRELETVDEPLESDRRFLWDPGMERGFTATDRVGTIQGARLSYGLGIRGLLRLLSSSSVGIPDTTRSDF